MLESPLQFTPSPRSSCPSSPDHPTTTAASMRKHFTVPAAAAGSSGSGSTSGSKRSSGTYSVDCNASLWRRLSSKLTATTATATTTATTTASTTIEANIEQVHNNNHNKSEMNTIAATTATAEVVVTEDVWRIAASVTRMQDLVRKIAFPSLL